MTCRCNGQRLEFGGWMGPTPEAPFPRPCPVCSADLTPRQIQVLVAEWLLDNPDDPKVRQVRASMAVHDARGHYRNVLQIGDSILRSGTLVGRNSGKRATLNAVANADLVVRMDGTVVKDRYGETGYKLSSTELRRIRQDCDTFKRLP